MIGLAISPLSIQRSRAAEPRVFILDVARLHAVREKLRAGDQTLAPALEQLKRDADAAFDAGRLSVVNPELTAAAQLQFLFKILCRVY